MVRELRAQISVEAEGERKDKIWESRRQRRDRALSIKSLGGGVFRVSGPAIERMVVQTDWDNDEAITYLQHRFDRMGLDDALAKAGCKNGDEVRILGYSFDYDGFDDEDEFAELSDSDDQILSEFEDADPSDDMFDIEPEGDAPDGGSE